jgi:hypothetical protein
MCSPSPDASLNQRLDTLQMTYIVGDCFEVLASDNDHAETAAFFAEKNTAKYALILDQTLDAIKSNAEWIEVRPSFTRCLGSNADLLLSARPKISRISSSSAKQQGFRHESSEAYLGLSNAVLTHVLALGYA